MMLNYFIIWSFIFQNFDAIDKSFFLYPIFIKKNFTKLFKFLNLKIKFEYYLFLNFIKKYFIKT